MMNFEQYKAQFPYKGKAVYTTVYERHCGEIKTKKPKFAVNNLEKIFKATFKISSRIGFHEMSLRDLCKETGLSMGGIYSCIESKDTIAIFIKDLVQHVSSETLDTAISQDNSKQALEDIIRHSIYTADLLHPWFYFLYFETRCLSKKHQQDSKNIELNMIDTMEKQLKKIGPKKNRKNYRIIATMALAMIQDRHLKHWKYKSGNSNLDKYAEEVITLVHSTLNQ